MTALSVCVLLFIGPPALFELTEWLVVFAARYRPSLNRFLDQGDHQ